MIVEETIIMSFQEKSRLGRYFNEIHLFSHTFLTRIVSYFGVFSLFLATIVKYVSFYLWKAKKAFIRLLMRREGVLNTHPRATVATLSFGVFLSIIPLNVTLGSPLQGENTTNPNIAIAGNTVSTVLAANRSVNAQESRLPSINEVVTHRVQSGETLSSISAEYLVPVDAIAYVNEISEATLLHPGDELTIPPVEGLTHKVDSGESIASIAEKYNVSPQSIVDANLLKPPFNVFSGDMLVIPGGEVPHEVPQPVVLAQSTPAPATLPAGGLSLESIAGGGGYIMPTPGRITQYASYYHMALDIAKGCGEPIWASQAGTVVYSGWRAGGYGIMVELVHADGRVSQYAHMSSNAAVVGQNVAQGDVIGYTGATGIAYGCHLHFVVQQGGRAINPLSVL